MQTPVSDLKFKWPWRPSQERVLNMLERHIADRKMHIVAAPGAGKTTLGLELFRRLGRPTLVLSPTRTIRDQWVTRLHDFFPPEADFPPTWVSTDWKTLGFFTSVTYQALHTEFRLANNNGEASEALPAEANNAPISVDDQSVESEFEELQKALNDAEIKTLIARIQEANIGTLILDEAHHLRAEWWKALSTVIEALPDLHLVALTATPPYDVVGQEWDRYQELCGPIDEEISVPELVKVATLCPHDDFVYAIEVTESDRVRIQQYAQARHALFEALLMDDVFAATLQQHPFLQEAPAPEEVLAKPELATALLSYFKTRGMPLADTLPKLMGVQVEEVPAMHAGLWQALVRAYLFDKAWVEDEAVKAHRDALATRLRRDELLYRRELRLVESRPVKRQIALSSAKITACVNIYQMERKFRGETLRQVFLTDFIRDEYFDKPLTTTELPLGAVTVFTQLLTWIEPENLSRMALLTGRLIVVHQDQLPAIKALVKANITTKPMDTRPEFIILNTPNRNDLTNALTTLLGSGNLHVLVGTRSLLGEGWDAPVINSLVLASYVGSFMLTNQMRGRAIRTDRAHPAKASSIWHIVALDPTNAEGLDDWQDLTRRMETFVGLSAKNNHIESGLHRLNLPLEGYIKGLLGLPPKHDSHALQRNNEEMAKRLDASPGLKARWDAAINLGDEQRVLPSMEVARPPSMKPLYFGQTLAYLLMEIVSIVTLIVLLSLQTSGTTSGGRTVYLIAILVTAVFAFIFVLPKLVRVAILAVRHYPVDGSLKQIGYAVRDALAQADLIQTDVRRLKLITTKLDDGAYAIALAGGTFYEQSLFADCMSEALGVIENPRYIITRTGQWLKLNRTDYHAVPYMLGVNKERALLFWSIWERRVSPCELIYTRTPEGRQTLLKARAKAFSTAVAPKGQRRDRWH